jgi:ribosome maturation factor RimP
MQSLVAKRAWEVSEALVGHEGMEIVDIEYHREGHGAVLRFYLDRDDGIGVDELATMSRRLGDLLEVHDVVPGHYTLEVSSPGINRRLRQPEHFRRYVGKRVRVRTLGRSEGRRQFVGALRAVEERGIVVDAADGSRFIEFDDIAKANYEHDFAE